MFNPLRYVGTTRSTVGRLLWVEVDLTEDVKLGHVSAPAQWDNVSPVVVREEFPLLLTAEGGLAFASLFSDKIASLVRLYVKGGIDDNGEYAEPIALTNPKNGDPIPLSETLISSIGALMIMQTEGEFEDGGVKYKAQVLSFEEWVYTAVGLPEMFNQALALMKVCRSQAEDSRKKKNYGAMPPKK